MKKILLALITLTLITACTSNSSSKNTSTPEEFIVTIAGDTYELPFKVSSLSENGWETRENITRELDVDSKKYETLFTKENEVIYVTIENLDWTTQTISDSYVTTLYVGGELYDGRTMAAISLSNNVTLETSISDVFDIFKLKKEDAFEVRDSIFYTSYIEYNQNYEFEFGIEDDLLKAVIVKNNDNTAIREAGRKNLDIQVPEAVTKYERVSTLGTDWTDGTFSLNKDVYKLPMPLQVFLDDGWKISDGDSLLPSKSSSIVELTKGKHELELSLYNPETFVVEAQHAMIYEIDLYNYDDESDDLILTIANGVNSSHTYDEALAILGPDSVDEDGTEYLFLFEETASIFLGFDENQKIQAFYYEIEID